MTENEQIFWNRVLELAQSQLKQATYEFFVHDARLIKVDNHVATIFLDQMKELFWEKNLKDVILTAGFEVYNAQIAVDYVYEDRKSTRLNSSHANISYAVFCLKKKKTYKTLI